MAKNKENKKTGEERTFDKGTHPGAYVTNRDVDRDRLEFFDLVDRVDFIDPISRKELQKAEEEENKPANQASPPATDPPVPNRAHTEM